MTCFVIKTKYHQIIREKIGFLYIIFVYDQQLIKKVNLYLSYSKSTSFIF